MNALQEIYDLRKLRAFQLLALLCLLVLIATIVFDARTTVRDPDIWWHLKTGDWIVEHSAVPYFGIFSRTAATRPWISYSWGYQVLLSRSYAWFGLVGLAMFGVLLTLAVTFVLFWVLRRLSGSFWIAWALALVGSFAFLFTLMPRPVFVTMILFTILLACLLDAQRTGRMKLLWWLPLIFVVWANVHIQFIYGLAVLGLFMGINLLQRVASRMGIEITFLHPPALPLPGLVGVLLACFAATFVGPYNYHVYRVVAAYSNSHVPYFMIQELAASDFKHFVQYVLLLLAAAAYFAVGWKQKLDLFKLSLLIVASVVAFRTQRDAWFLAIPAVLFIADVADQDHKTDALPVLTLAELAGLGVSLALLLWLVATNVGFNVRDLDRAVSHEYPVDAANFVRRNSFPGPLYNTLDWGGFLIWYLPQYPVTIDGRNDLYGDEIDLLTFRSSQGDAYTSDPYLKESGLVLLPKKLPLAQLLTIDPNFRLVYQDGISMVFTRNYDRANTPTVGLP